MPGEQYLVSGTRYLVIRDTPLKSWLLAQWLGRISAIDRVFTQESRAICYDTSRPCHELVR